MKVCLLTLFLIFFVVAVKCNDYSVIKPKMLSRLPRSSSKANNEEFEKFFLKASKSVPRIGRRGGSLHEIYNTNTGQQFRTLYPYQQNPSPSKHYENPFWYNIAQMYEYNPDLLEYLSNFNQLQGDDPFAYDVGDDKFQKSNFGHENKETMEYRVQAEV